MKLPLHYRLFDNLTEDEAFNVEKELINHFGRISNGGILTNLTDGGDGHSGYHEPKISHWKKVYQYNLDGTFVKEWSSLTEVSELFENIGNISTAIKRNGTFHNYIWCYEYKENLKSKIKFQMPIKYTNIKQIDVKNGNIINIHENALVAEQKLNLRNGARNKIYECINKKLKTAYGYKWEI